MTENKIELIEKKENFYLCFSSEPRTETFDLFFQLIQPKILSLQC